MVKNETSEALHALRSREAAIELKCQEISQQLKRKEEERKVLDRKIRDLERKQRTTRLCTRGGMVESFLGVPEQFSNDQVMTLLTLAFRQAAVQETLEGMQESMTIIEEDESSQREETKDIDQT